MKNGNMERKINFTSDPKKPFYKWVKENYGYTVGTGIWEHTLEYGLKLEILKRYCYEKRGVLISIYCNASGFCWAMQKAEGGTNLGDYDYKGPNHSGCFDDYYESLQDALILELCGGLTKFKKKSGSRFHWSLYVDFCRDNKKKKPHENDILRIYKNTKI